MTKYKLAYSDDGDTWLDYTEKGIVRVSTSLFKLYVFCIHSVFITMILAS